VEAVEIKFVAVIVLENVAAPETVRVVNVPAAGVFTPSNVQMTESLLSLRTSL
jgi:hypothetical protein